MKSNNRQRGITLLELIIASAVLATVMIVAGTVFVSGMRFFQEGSQRVSEQSDVRMVMLDISKHLRQSQAGDVILYSSESINVDGRIYTFRAAQATITVNNGVTGDIVLARDIQQFDVEMDGDTVTITIQGRQTQSAVTTKVSFRSIPTPTPREATP